MAISALKQVGEFIPQRRAIRTIRNPLDKATIISIYPKEIVDVKETLQPSEFKIAGGTVENPGVTVVGTASWWLDTDPDRPLTEIPVSAIQLADSLVRDYCNGMLGCNMVDAIPGLFFVPGELTKDDVLSRCKIALAQAAVKQKNWFTNLIKLADSLWARTNGNPLVIWDEMRMAARELGLDKPWIRDFQMAEMVKCFACGALRNPEYPICPQCKTIDQSHPKAKDIKIAG